MLILHSLQSVKLELFLIVDDFLPSQPDNDCEMF